MSDRSGHASSGGETSRNDERQNRRRRYVNDAVKKIIPRVSIIRYGFKAAKSVRGIHIEGRRSKQVRSGNGGEDRVKRNRICPRIVTDGYKVKWRLDNVHGSSRSGEREVGVNRSSGTEQECRVGYENTVMRIPRRGEDGNPKSVGVGLV